MLTRSFPCPCRWSKIHDGTFAFEKFPFPRTCPFRETRDRRTRACDFCVLASFAGFYPRRGDATATPSVELKSRRTAPRRERINRAVKQLRDRKSSAPSRTLQQRVSQQGFSVTRPGFMRESTRAFLRADTTMCNVTGPAYCNITGDARA